MDNYYLDLATSDLIGWKCKQIVKPNKWLNLLFNLTYSVNLIGY